MLFCFSDRQYLKFHQSLENSKRSFGDWKRDNMNLKFLSNRNLKILNSAKNSVNNILSIKFIFLMFIESDQLSLST